MSSTARRTWETVPGVILHVRTTRAYRTIRNTADIIFEAGVFSDDIEPRSAPPYLYGTKQFNEQYRWAPFYFAYRR